MPEFNDVPENMSPGDWSYVMDLQGRACDTLFPPKKATMATRAAVRVIEQLLEDCSRGKPEAAAFVHVLGTRLLRAGNHHCQSLLLQ